jgi:hypothetical protein
MPTRIVEDSGPPTEVVADPSPRTTVVQQGNGGMGMLVATLIGLVIIAIVVLVILHATLGVA